MKIFLALAAANVRRGQNWSWTKTKTQDNILSREMGLVFGLLVNPNFLRLPILVPGCGFWKQLLAFGFSGMHFRSSRSRLHSENSVL